MLFVLPALVFMILITVIPLLGTTSLSFVKYEITRPDEIHFVGFKNYINLARDARFLNSVKVMFLLILVPVTIQLIFGLSLAVALNERLKGTRWMRLFFLTPAIMPPIVIGLVWKLFIIPQQGGLAYFLQLFGARSPDLLSSPIGALSVIMVASVWTGTPFVTIMYLSAIESISNSYYEAAEIDGASWFQRHRVITLPLVTSVTKTLIIFRTLEALAIFPVIFILTGGGPASATEPINFYAYVTGFDYLQLDYAAAIIVVFFLLLMLISFPFLRSLVRKSRS